MTPYKEGKKVIIDPTIAPNKLHFGTVDRELYKKIGTISSTKYLALLKTMTYEVTFPSGEQLWFKECEIA